MGIKKIFKNGKNGKDGYVVLETGKGGKGIKTNLPSDKVKKGLVNNLPSVASQKEVEATEVKTMMFGVTQNESNELSIRDFSKDGKYEIIVTSKDIHSRAKITFVNLEDKSEVTISEEPLRGREFYPWDDEYSQLEVKSTLLNEANHLLYKLGFTRNDIKVEFAQMNKSYPKLRRIDNDGLDIGANFPVYIVKDNLPWRGWHDEIEDLFYSDSPNEEITQEYIDNYQGKKVIDYTPASDEIVLTWVQDDFPRSRGLNKTADAGWAVCFWANLYSNDELILFVKWDDLEGIAKLAKGIENEEALKVTAALLGQKAPVKD